MAIDESVTEQGDVAVTGTATGEGGTGIVGIFKAKRTRGRGGVSDRTSSEPPLSRYVSNQDGYSDQKSRDRPRSLSDDPDREGVGVFGKSDDGSGVVGETKTELSAGVLGVHTGTGGQGVRGLAENGMGAVGESIIGYGVYGVTKSGIGVYGKNEAGTGVYGKSEAGIGVHAKSEAGIGVYGSTNSKTASAIVGINYNEESEGAAIYGEKRGYNGYAGYFYGNVYVTGVLTVSRDILLTGGDCAEDFDLSTVEGVEPGMVMAIDDNGNLSPCRQAYDKRVAGVVSGAGSFRAAIILDKQTAKNNRKPIALVGKVYCKADAGYAPIEVGDLLTTSDTLGHAMKATDHLKAFGAVIGKALSPLKEGQQLIPILVALQ